MESVQTKLQVPPLPEEEAIKRAFARLAQMTPEEFFQTLVHAGIYTSDGQLTELYANEEPSAYRPTD